VFKDSAADHHSGYDLRLCFLLVSSPSEIRIAFRLLFFFNTGHIKGIGLSELGTVVRFSSSHGSRWVSFAGSQFKGLNLLRNSRVIFEYLMLASYFMVVGASMRRNRHATVQNRGTDLYQLPASLSISEYDDRKGQVLPQNIRVVILRHE